MTESDRKDVTVLLRRWRTGDPAALERLTPLVYDELHRLARRAMRQERSDHTLQATGLLNEAFIGLIRADVEFNDRAHFFALAARMMRRILVDHAIAQRAAKRGSGAEHLPLDEALALPVDEAGHAALVADLDDAIRVLETVDDRKARVLEMHYFGGLNYAEMAEVEGVAPSTINADLRFARAWLREQLALD